MKIGLDYFSVSGRAGAGTYARELIKNIALTDRINTYYLYDYLHKRFNKYRKESNLIDQNNFFYRNIFLPHLTNSKFLLPVQAKARKEIFHLRYKFDKLDLFHLINPVNYFGFLNNFVITIHDLAPYYDKGFVKDSTVLFYRKYFREIINKAKIIITDTNFTKKDIIDKFGIDENKIKVIYLAADDIFMPTFNQEILRKYGINKKYILSVGQLQPRKNLKTLLVVYSLLPNSLKEEYDLVLVGPPRDEATINQLRELIQSLKIENNVKLLGYVDICDLPALYSQAYIFIYLSLLEGFGLPVLESLKCGRPALVSNNSSLPEVAGPAGVLVNPENLEQILFELKNLLGSQELVANLIKKILQQIKKFDWQKTARDTIEVYKQCI